MKFSPKQYDPAKGPQSGVWLGEPNEKYHATDCISLSKLWKFRNRPRKYEGKYLTGEDPDTPTEDMNLGSALHTYVLEGEEAFFKDFAVTPKISYRSNTDKENAVRSLNSLLKNPQDEDMISWLFKGKKEDIEGYFADLPSRRQVSEEQFEEIRLWALHLSKDPAAAQLLANGYPEVVFRSGVSKAHGYAIQCRTDWLNMNGCEVSGGEPYFLDLKTIAKVDSERDLESEIFHRGYYRCKAFYTKVMQAVLGERKVDRLFFIFIEKKWPYGIFAIESPPEYDELAEAELSVDMPNLSWSLENGDFSDPCKVGGLVPAPRIPPWKQAQAADEGLFVRKLG